LASPSVDEARANIRAPRNLGHNGARLFNRRQNPKAIFVAPTTMPFAAINVIRPMLCS
jgi:hypothetical protein